MKKLKIKKGDQVVVLTGRDRGKKGEVVAIITKKRKALVKGINVVKKHVKAQGKDQPGGIIDLEKPLPVFRLGIFCPKCKKPSRISWLVDKSGQKQRICSRCKSLLS
ncbi:MAG: 50S ribosomal protein L24 [Candidatus Shapirobacteria bacterium]